MKLSVSVKKTPDRKKKSTLSGNHIKDLKNVPCQGTLSRILKKKEPYQKSKKKYLIKDLKKVPSQGTLSRI